MAVRIVFSDRDGAHLADDERVTGRTASNEADGIYECLVRRGVIEARP